MAIDTTVGGVTSNSYISVADALEYLGNNRLYADCFTGLDQATQESLLIWATELIDLTFEFGGYVVSNQQRLRWPRVGVLDEDLRFINQSGIPVRIAHATAVLALELAKRDRSEVPEIISQGLRSTGVGTIRADIDPNAVLPVIPDFVITMISVYGRVKATGLRPNSARTAKIWRA